MTEVIGFVGKCYDHDGTWSLVKDELLCEQVLMVVEPARPSWNAEEGVVWVDYAAKTCCEDNHVVYMNRRHDASLVGPHFEASDCLRMFI